VRLLPLLTVMALAGCPKKAIEDRTRSFTVVHINDTYRAEGTPDGGGMARVRTLIAQQELKGDVLRLHGGDFLYPSLMSTHGMHGKQMVQAMNALDGDLFEFDDHMFVTFGNHEFDKSKPRYILEAIEQSQFRWLATNIAFDPSIDIDPEVVQNLVVDRRGGIAVGLFSLSIDSAHPPYVAAFKDPTNIAREATQMLREAGAEVIIGLTHLNAADDCALLETLGDDGPDIIFGGHDHSEMQLECNGRFVMKGQAEALSAAVAKISINPDGELKITPTLKRLPKSAYEDQVVAQTVAATKADFERRYCRDVLEQPGECLSEPLAKAGTRLVAEETTIRRFETNVGDWIADLAFSMFDADAALLHAGGMRLNYDLPAGADITLEAIEALFVYPTNPVVIEMTGQELQDTLNVSVSDWTGNGHFLQVSGLAFRHDPELAVAKDIQLLGENGGPLDLNATYRVIMPQYLVTRDPDFSFLHGRPILERQSGESADPFKDLAVEELRRMGTIDLSTDGRICHPERSECLLTP